jgi:pimeloyl-ACP methyl ester carboxylesterase
MSKNVSDQASKTIVLIHGAWLTPEIWAPWRARYEALGHTTLAPAWPLMDRPIEELRLRPHPELGRLTLGRIVDHYAAIIGKLPEKPILIGHSYGGLIVQMLLDRGLGAVGVSIDPGPAAGIVAGPKAFLSALPVFVAWRGWSRALTMSFGAFARNFANGLPEAVQRTAYDRHIVPAPGRIYYQSVLGIGAGVGWKNATRAPLLLVNGEDDRTVEPGMVRQNLKKYARSTAVTALKSFPARSHFLIAAPGWEEIADYALQWAATQIGPATAERRST